MKDLTNTIFDEIYDNKLIIIILTAEIYYTGYEHGIFGVMWSVHRVTEIDI